jgi:hypothetical protein
LPESWNFKPRINVIVLILNILQESYCVYRNNSICQKPLIYFENTEINQQHRAGLHSGTFWTRIRDVLDSIFGRDSNYSGWCFSWFASEFPGKYWNGAATSQFIHSSVTLQLDSRHWECGKINHKKFTDVSEDSNTLEKNSFSWQLPATRCSIGNKLLMTGTNAISVTRETYPHFETNRNSVKIFPGWNYTIPSPYIRSKFDIFLELTWNAVPLLCLLKFVHMLWLILWVILLSFRYCDMTPENRNSLTLENGPLTHVSMEMWFVETELVGNAFSGFHVNGINKVFHGYEQATNIFHGDWRLYV